MKKLTIAGTGIKFLAHLTTEVMGAIRSSSCVLYLLNEPAIKHWVSINSKISFSLDDIYYSCIDRMESYEKIVGFINDNLDKYDDLVLLIYGHPIVFSTISAKLINQYSENELQLSVLPGISALDCLFADLGIDPGEVGFQSYDSTIFINNDIEYSAKVPLVLWQIAAVNESRIIKDKVDKSLQKKGLRNLKNRLLKKYPPNHQIIIYVATLYAGISSEIIKFNLNSLDNTLIPRLGTLYIPPITQLK
ncbi:TPA: SAM-dependent methyltransferase [Legionella pneumophila]